MVDIKFDDQDSKLPEICEALEIEREGMFPLIVEVEQHIGQYVRTIAMDSTDGLCRGMKAKH